MFTFVFISGICSGSPSAPIWKDVGVIFGFFWYSVACLFLWRCKTAKLQYLLREMVVVGDLGTSFLICYVICFKIAQKLLSRHDFCRFLTIRASIPHGVPFKTILVILQILHKKGRLKLGLKD